VAGRKNQLRVAPLPDWLDVPRLLGPISGPTSEADAAWQLAPGEQGIEAHATLGSADAADLAARLRGIGFDGHPLHCEIEPPLSRSLVRRARTDDARRRRATTPGFTRSGTRDDEIGRMSLTPESLAMRIAAWAKGRAVVDAGCGIGGNAIAFARSGCRVLAIEADAQRLELARHNAAVYGVAGQIEFVHGDALTLVPQRRDPEAILFVDPPWGADWSRAGCGLAELPMLAALLPHADAYAQLWAKLPPSFATRELLDGGGPGHVDALFGEAEGDRRRVKFVLVRRQSAVAQ
jgi:SAM-dependent methyltransferase